MKPHDPFQDLERELLRWRDTLEALECTVAEDRPATNDVALADCYYDAVHEALGWLAEAIEAVRRTAQTVATQGDSRFAGRSLGLAHEHIIRLTTHHLTQLASGDRLAELAELGTRRGRQWHRWADAVRRSLSAVPEVHECTNSALASAWQELLANAAAPAPILNLTPN